MPNEVKHSIHAPLVDTVTDMPVTEAIIDAAEIAPSVVCYCSLPVARYKVRKLTSPYCD